MNVFANDGSFLELFKRKMEAEQQREREAAAAAAAAEAPGGAGPGPHRPSDGSKRSGGALSFVRTRGPRPPPAPAGPAAARPARPLRRPRLRVSRGYRGPRAGSGGGGGFFLAAAACRGRASPGEPVPRARVQAPVLPVAPPGSGAGTGTGALGGAGGPGALELRGHLWSPRWGGTSPGGPAAAFWSGPVGTSVLLGVPCRAAFWFWVFLVSS